MNRNMEIRSNVENEIMYKKRIYNNLVLTTNDEAAVDIVERFIIKIIGYKPNVCEILDSREDLQCPILYIFKALLFLNDHRFTFNPKVHAYFELASKMKEELKINNVELESWEDNWFDFVNAMINNKQEKVNEIFLKNSEQNPNDLIGFKTGMVFGLYNGDKIYMKKLSDEHYKYKDNHENSYFIGIYSFILEELKMFEESEKWVKKGLEMDLKNIWIQHVYTHIMYQTNRVKESINFLEKHKHMWKENASNFIHKHIKWHLAIAYMEQEEYSKSNEIIDHILTHHFEEAECPLAILGYILRMYIRNQKDLNGVIGNDRLIIWYNILLPYLSNLEIYTKHLLFDVLAVWLMSYLINIHYVHKDIDLKQILQSVLAKIEENVSSNIVANSATKDYFQINYIKILQGMKLFGEENYSKALDILITHEEAFWKIGASDEQLYVLFEAELFSAFQCGDRANFNRLIKFIFGDQLEQLLYIRKLESAVNK